METSILPYVPPPQQNLSEFFIGCTVTIISKFEIRYVGAFYDLNLQNSSLLLLNVICYGTEGRRKDGLQIPPSNEVYDYIIFKGNEIKFMDPLPILPKGFKQSNAAKPPRPPSSSKRRKKVPLLTYDNNLENPQAITTTTPNPYASLLNDTRLHIASSNPYIQPQYPASYIYHPYNYPYPSMPYQAPITNVSSSLFQYPYLYEPLHPQTYFTTFPPVPISIKPKDKKSCDFEWMKNMEQYNLWGFIKEDRPKEKPRHKFGPIARPVKKVKEVDNTNPKQEVKIES